MVVEAVQSKFDAGYKSAYLATKDAMGDVTMAIVSCTCVFMAVFIPVTFMGGTSGVFYTQFGITMATAVGISMISALTLCPALCAIMMRPSDGTKSAKSINGRVRAAYNASFNACLLYTSSSYGNDKDQGATSLYYKVSDKTWTHSSGRSHAFSVRCMKDTENR